MPDCIRELEGRGLHAAVLEAAASKPFLGICIGQQMLFDHSEEGNVPGLGVFRGEVRRFPEALMFAADGARLKVPHMGWNEVRQQGRTCFGMAFPTTPASISCTATTSIRPSARSWPQPRLRPALYQCGGTG